MGKRGRRIAYHKIVLPDGAVIRLGVVTVTDGVVTDVSTFSGEPAMTEWKGGTAFVRKDTDGRLTLWDEEIVID
jgi:hypothetical protein